MALTRSRIPARAIVPGLTRLLRALTLTGAILIPMQAAAQTAPPPAPAVEAPVLPAAPSLPTAPDGATAAGNSQTLSPARPEAAVAAGGPSLDAASAEPALPVDMADPAPDAPGALEPAPVSTIGMLEDASERAEKFLIDGGPSIWAIAALSVVTVALILWKTWRFFLSGVWSRKTSRQAVDLWEAGDTAAALALVSPRRGLRSRMTTATMRARLTLPDSAAREETSRVAKRLLASQGGGLRALELIATIAPLLGLLGTVLGMIAAFQALQEAGNRADPALLAGGIWEALLTTAAGMAVAIPASAALTWFEAVIEKIRQDMEDLAARIFIAPLAPAAPDTSDVAKRIDSPTPVDSIDRLAAQ